MAGVGRDVQRSRWASFPVFVVFASSQAEVSVGADGCNELKLSP